MRLLWPAIVTLMLGSGAALAQTECPPVPDHNGALASLVEAARAAPNEAEAQRLSREMWALWTDAPDAISQEVLDRGMRKRESFDLLGAIGEFDTLVAYCPGYAEGYNQRAFAKFLGRDFDGALSDLNQALDLSPAHIGVLSGRALTYMELGDLTRARSDLEAALSLNPWLSERHLLAPGAPLAPGGDDI